MLSCNQRDTNYPFESGEVARPAGRMGGHLGCKEDGPSGWITLWQPTVEFNIPAEVLFPAFP